MTIVVTGATGYAGHHLVARLTEGDQEVIALLRASSSPERLLTLPRPPRIERLEESGAMPPGLFGAQTIFHLGFAPGNAAAALIEDSLTFSLRLLAAAPAGARFVNVGTWWQFDAQGHYHPNSLYAAAKQAVGDLLTYYVLSGRLLGGSVIPFDIYGPEDWRGKLLSRLMAPSESPLPATDGTQEIDLIHVEDLIDGILAAAAGLAPGVPHRFTLGSGQPLTVRALADKVAAALGRPLAIQWGAIPHAPGQIFKVPPADRPPPNWAPRIALEAGLSGLLRPSPNGHK